MVGACYYVVLLCSFHLDFSLVALHTPSFLFLCNPLSYKCHFPSKTSKSTKLCGPSQVFFSLFVKVLNILQTVKFMHGP